MKLKSLAYLGKEDIYNFLIFIHFFFGNVLFRKTGYLLCNLGFTLLSKQTNELTVQRMSKTVNKRLS